MSYQLYRNTTLGHTLQESLDELMQLQMLSPALALRVLIQFDKSINNALATRVKTKLHFKAEKLNTYRFCDNVWTFMLKEVEFRENSELAKVDRVKIVACDAKSSVPARTARSTPRSQRCWVTVGWRRCVLTASSGSVIFVAR